MTKTIDDLISDLEELEVSSGILGITVVAVSGDGEQYIVTIAEDFILPMLLGLQVMAHAKTVAAANAISALPDDPECAPAHDPACPAPHLN